jgi:hypothetical protein
MHNDLSTSYHDHIRGCGWLAFALHRIVFAVCSRRSVGMTVIVSDGILVAESHPDQ